jgi:hypothetical protein
MKYTLCVFYADFRSSDPANETRDITAFYKEAQFDCGVYEGPALQYFLRSVNRQYHYSFVITFLAVLSFTLNFTKLPPFSRRYWTKIL